MSYQIEIEVPVVEGLQQKLQAAYDNGAAGFFNLQFAGKTVKIVFDREISDDANYIELRVAQGFDVHRAAREQLAAEFEEGYPVELAEIILTLRSGQGSVRGLSDELVQAERIVETPVLVKKPTSGASKLSM